MSKKLSAVVLAAFLALSAVGMSACNVRGGESALTDATLRKGSIASGVSDVSDEAKEEESSGGTAIKEEDSGVSSKTDTVDKSEVSIVADTSNSSSDTKAEDTVFGKFMLALKDNYDAGKKLMIKSDSVNMTMYKTDGKDCIVMAANIPTDTSSDVDISALLSGKRIMVSDGKYMYIITGDTYYKSETTESTVKEWSELTDSFDNVKYVKREDGYEYFTVDTVPTDTLIAKVENGVCSVYQGSVDKLYMTVEYADVTAEDKALVDISNYKESDTNPFEQFIDLDDVADDTDEDDDDENFELAMKGEADIDE